MSFHWVNSDIATPCITIYESNFTLNRVACNYFTDVRYVLLGIDEDTDQLGIRPVTKEEIDLNLYPANNLHRIYIGKSYGRVSNKQFIQEIAQKYHMNFKDQSGIKYNAQFDEESKALTIHL